jgi:hypothetical protein
MLIYVLDDCYLIGLDGSLIYTGTINITRNGTECQRWDVDYPHTKIINMTSKNENYCRNPEGGELWCYTTDENIIWDYCNIKQCSKFYINHFCNESKTQRSGFNFELAKCSSYPGCKHIVIKSNGTIFYFELTECSTYLDCKYNVC